MDKNRSNLKFWSIASEEEKIERLRISYENKVIRKSYDECWDWKKHLDDGYAIIKSGPSRIRGHRLSWILNYGTIPNGLCVLHKCDNKKCTNPKHLFLGTKADNVKDMTRKGRNKAFPGESNPNATITEEKVRKIKIMLNSNKSPTEIANQLAIKRNIVYLIKYGKIWKTA